MENLRIDNPCPMLLMRMGKTGDNFTCASCSKEVIDFRDKSQEEIANTITANTCGIFNNSQLPGQQRMSFFRQGMFYALTVLSFLGFNVSPLNAAPQKQNPRSGQLEMSQGINAESRDKDKEKKKKKSRKKKKTEFKTIGCPSF